VNEGLSASDLELAVSGLSGIMGVLIMPTISAWLRLLLQWLESDRSGLGRNPRISGVGVLRALSTTLALGFFSVSLVRAAAEHRQAQPEAPVFGLTMTGIVVGVVFWAVYALALRGLRKDWKTMRQRRRIG
jgi:hypothetical protein